MINLQDFVKEALVQIANGIRSADEALADSDAIVNPPNINLDATGRVYGHVFNGSIPRPIERVTFDVAVTANEAQSTAGGVGVVMGVVALGSKGESDRSSSSVSRLQFSVPLALPRSSKLPAKEGPRSLKSLG